MSISMYDASVPVFLHTLGSLQTILKKAAAHAEAKKFDANILLATRVAPDMFPFSNQVQFAGESAKSTVARLIGDEVAKFEGTETTLEQLIARIDNTIVHLSGVEASQFEGSETRIVTVNTPRGTVSFSGLRFLRHWGLPNFFFHVTTTYNLLRHNGVDIGKADYLGRLDE